MLQHASTWFYFSKSIVLISPPHGPVVGASGSSFSLELGPACSASLRCKTYQAAQAHSACFIPRLPHRARRGWCRPSGRTPSSAPTPAAAANTAAALQGLNAKAAKPRTEPIHRVPSLRCDSGCAPPVNLRWQTPEEFCLLLPGAGKKGTASLYENVD